MCAGRQFKLFEFREKCAEKLTESGPSAILASWSRPRAHRRGIICNAAVKQALASYSSSGGPWKTYSRPALWPKWNHLKFKQIGIDHYMIILNICIVYTRRRNGKVGQRLYLSNPQNGVPYWDQITLFYPNSRKNQTECQTMVTPYFRWWLVTTRVYSCDKMLRFRVTWNW